MLPLGVAVSDRVADFGLGFNQSGEEATVEQFGFEATRRTIHPASVQLT